MTIERAMQLVKGGFSYRIKKEFGYPHDVWQRGLVDQQIYDDDGISRCREYIANNPVKAGLARTADEYPFTFAYLAEQKLAAAKAGQKVSFTGTTEVVPFHKQDPQGGEL
jgi:putative transposase